MTGVAGHAGRQAAALLHPMIITEPNAMVAPSCKISTSRGRRRASVMAGIKARK
jgi:hypothetical protein